MRVYTYILILIALMVILPDLYIYLRFIKNRMKKSIAILHWIFSLFIALSATGVLFRSGSVQSPQDNFHILLYIVTVASIYISKLVFLTFDLIFYITKKRWRKIQYAGYATAFAAFLCFIYAVFFGRFNFGREEYSVEIEGLPNNFDGFKIVQISDLHLGGFCLNKERLLPLFDMIQEENADLIVETGDIITNFATEMNGFEKHFEKIKTKDSMLAIFGNHDYGDYYKWGSEEEKQRNMDSIIAKRKKMGFKLLRNSSHIIEKNGERIAVIGVENWGKPPFPQLADIAKAKEGTDSVGTKILLAHDPDFFKHEVCRHKDIQLTLSGHTHASQIGIEIGNFKISPAQLKFKYWDGLYKVDNQTIIVSRGLGCVGMPSRWGMSPSYNVITLRKKK